MAGAFAVRFSKCSPLRNPLSGALALRRRSSRASLEILAPRSLISSQLERGTRVGIARASISTSAIGGRTERKAEMDLFQISPSSVLKLQRGDITKWLVNGSTDAIVNAANERLQRGGGVDGAIHRAAGAGLQAACLEIPEVQPGVRCPTGEARITPAFQLPVSQIIHTVGPIYDAHRHPEILLRNAYRNSLQLAKENNIEYIAFPSISCGVFGYPFDEASNVAISTIKEFSDNFKEVHFVLFEDGVYNAWLESARKLL
ncbi:macro domain-containing protein VPA0103-like [Dioscorea cayenensis subsp. rotundata]|uniref:Macro domain-containing protein VPA0103-like n=1 Tax=Dioscorea cayennensis subsp. rotundata TaxID=55577 RepID=A0AB40BL76_DIOCR|nr:macro domain-containing protein VPA0103-like [Dioscorea cayenensis subsp. rotundata]